MYKFRLTLKDKQTRIETTFNSNNLQTLINDCNKCKDVTFVIVSNHNHKIMMKGVK